MEKLEEIKSELENIFIVDGYIKTIDKDKGLYSVVSNQN